MNVEIERKFLVADATIVERADGPPARLKQGYLATGETNVRVRVSPEKSWLTIKGKTIGISRAEFEYEIPRDDAELMLTTLSRGIVIEKDRYLVREGAFTWEVDVFHGANAPLLLAEIELDSESETVEIPDWVGEEVSGDARFKNARLAVRPYGSWAR